MQTKHQWHITTLLFTMLFLNGQNAQANASFCLCILDKHRLLKETQIAIQQSQKFQIIRQDIEAQYKKHYLQLQMEIKYLQKEAAVLQKNQINRRAIQLGKKENQLNEKIKQINQNLSDLDSQLTKNFDQLSAPIINDIQKKNNCSVLVAKDMLISFDEQQLDITTEVIKEMNKNETFSR